MYNLLKKCLPDWFIRYFEHRLRLVLQKIYSGNNFHCPLCGKNYRKFILINDNELLCPGCGSLPRKRLLFLYLTNETRIFSKNLKILHISPGKCFVEFFSELKNIEYISSDFEGRLSKNQYDILHIPHPDCSFDIIICFHILEHIIEDRKAMCEMFRTLKSGGKTLIQVPFKAGDTLENPSVIIPAERLQKFGQADHVRVYGMQDFKARLEDAGFQVKTINAIDFNNKYPIKKYGLNLGDKFLECTK